MVGTLNFNQVIVTLVKLNKICENVSVKIFID